MDLADGGREGPGEYPEGGEVLLEAGDPDRELLDAGVQNRDPLLQFGSAEGQAGDLLAEPVPEIGAGAPEPEVRPEGLDPGRKGEQGTDQDKYEQYGTHLECLRYHGAAEL